jgi:hypothetical protein
MRQRRLGVVGCVVLRMEGVEVIGGTDEGMYVVMVEDWPKSPWGD